MSGFDLLDRPLVFVPVKWPGLAVAEDGAGVPTENLIEVQVEILDREEFAEWMHDGAKDIVRRVDEFGEPDPTDKRTDAEIKTERRGHELATFKRVAKGWRKIKANGRVPAFNDENVAKLLLFPGFVSAFGGAYMQAWQGRVATREGNSDGSPPNGPGGEPTGETSAAPTSSIPAS